MNELVLVSTFWRECDDANFSKDAALLFFYLLKTYRERKDINIKMHPNKLSAVIKGFKPQDVQAATEELVARGYVSYEPPTDTCSSGIYRIVKKVAPPRIRTKKQ